MQASSFSMVLMGGDLGLTLFNQLLPTSQKEMLKRARFGSPTIFASQMQLAASLLSASGHVGLGLFLHAQSVYFGVMIRQWMQKRTRDRLVEIVSWLSLGLFFASSFLQYAPSQRVLLQVELYKTSLKSAFTGLHNYSFRSIFLKHACLRGLVLLEGSLTELLKWPALVMKQVKQVWAQAALQWACVLTVKGMFLFLTLRGQRRSPPCRSS